MFAAYPPTYDILFGIRNGCLTHTGRQGAESRNGMFFPVPSCVLPMKKPGITRAAGGSGNIRRNTEMTVEKKTEGTGLEVKVSGRLDTPITIW